MSADAETMLAQRLVALDGSRIGLNDLMAIVVVCKRRRRQCVPHKNFKCTNEDDADLCCTVNECALPAASCSDSTSANQNARNDT